MYVYEYAINHLKNIPMRSEPPSIGHYSIIENLIIDFASNEWGHIIAENQIMYVNTIVIGYVLHCNSNSNQIKLNQDIVLKIFVFSWVFKNLYKTIPCNYAFYFNPAFFLLMNRWREEYFYGGCYIDSL